MDAEGRGYNVEAFSTATRVTRLEHDALVHTNHALHGETVVLSQERPSELQDSSIRRLEHAVAALATEGIGFEQVAELTRHPRLCYRAAPPLELATCGAVIMRPRTRELWACEGPPDTNGYERFSLAAAERSVGGDLAPQPR
jgi:hypothetical protein